jgi:hypothetical protein
VDFGFNKKAGNETEHAAWGDNFEFRIANCEVIRKSCPSNSQLPGGIPVSVADFAF